MAPATFMQLDYMNKNVLSNHLQPRAASALGRAVNGSAKRKPDSTTAEEHQTVHKAVRTTGPSAAEVLRQTVGRANALIQQIQRLTTDTQHSSNHCQYAQRHAEEIRRLNFNLNDFDPTLQHHIQQQRRTAVLQEEFCNLQQQLVDVNVQLNILAQQVWMECARTRDPVELAVITQLLQEQTQVTLLASQVAAGASQYC